MLELLSQLDGFSSNDMIKVIATTNRPDVLDPALLRSGRLDRKKELPHLNEDARTNILKIHARKMHVSTEVVYEVAKNESKSGFVYFIPILVTSDFSRRDNVQFRRTDLIATSTHVQKDDTIVRI